MSSGMQYTLRIPSVCHVYVRIKSVEGEARIGVVKVTSEVVNVTGKVGVHIYAARVENVGRNEAATP